MPGTCHREGLDARFSTDVGGDSLGHPCSDLSSDLAVSPTAVV